jgi:Tc toxin complex TcA C-terminal TcB-binding domain
VSLAQGEMDQIDAQIVAGQVRLAIAQRELENHDLQVANARAVDDFLKSKFSGRDLFNWMSGQAAAVYYQSYQLALQLAQRAGGLRLRARLDLTATSFVTPGSWDSLKKGLLAGERLGQDLRQMEVAYLEQNQRELEITKHVSLAPTDPVSLIDLRRRAGARSPSTRRSSTLTSPATTCAG